MIPALLLLLMAFPATILTYSYANRRTSNELITVHLTMFLLEMFLYGAAWIAYVDHEELDLDLVALIGILLNVYVGVVLLLSRVVVRFSGIIRYAALAIPDEHILLGLGGWLFFKGILFSRYGAAVFGSLDARRLAGVPQSWLDLDRLLLWPAWGAYFLYIIKPRKGRFPQFTLLASAAFLFINLFFENNGGGKRLMLVTALLFVVVRPAQRRTKLKNLSLWCVAIVVASSMASYYQSVRVNFGHLVDGLQNEKDVTWSELTTAFIPEPENGFVADFENREAPISLLYDLTKAELDGASAKGAVIGQVLQNVLPNGLFVKQFADEDGAISLAFNLPAIDLATTTLAVLQAETNVLAYILTPLLYVAMFWAYLWLLSRRMREVRYSLITSIEVLAILGASVFTALNIESGLTTTLEIFRDLFGFLGVAFLAGLVVGLSQRYYPELQAPRR
jgi:hypothetical protein